MWGAAGGLNTHWIRSLLSAPAILSWFQPLRHSCISGFAPTKFVPLSEYITVALPLLAINRQRDIMKESVDKEWATSRCTLLVTRQVKRQPYIFSCFLRCFTFRGPKKSPPTFENAGATCRGLAGSPAIKGGSGFTLLLLRYELRCRIFLTAVRQRGIQYCRLSSFRTCWTPSCLSFSWQSITMRRLSSLSGDNTMGCRLENGISALSIRPPTRTISSPSRKGEREASLLLGETCWFLLRVAISWGKLFAWAVPVQNFWARSNSSTSNGPLWRSVLRHLQL